MKTINELESQDLNSVSGGETDLERYLKELKEKDLKNPLVDYGPGEQIEVDPSVPYDGDSNAHLLPREKKKPEIDSKY